MAEKNVLNHGRAKFQDNKIINFQILLHEFNWRYVEKSDLKLFSCPGNESIIIIYVLIHMHATLMIHYVPIFFF